MTKRTVLPALLLLTVPMLAHAKRGKHCREDIERLCPDARGDKAQIRACLAENADQLSEACGESVRKRQARRAEMQAACGADIEQLCPDAEGREIRRCLKENKDALSDQCKAAAARGKRGKRGKRGGGAAIREACGADAERLCGDAEGRERRQCMRQNRDAVSDECRTAMEARRGRRGER